MLCEGFILSFFHLKPFQNLTSPIPSEFKGEFQWICSKSLEVWQILNLKVQICRTRWLRFYPGWPSVVEGHKNWPVHQSISAGPQEWRPSKPSRWQIRAERSTPDVEGNHPPPRYVHGGMTPSHQYKSWRVSQERAPLFYLDGTLNEVGRPCVILSWPEGWDWFIQPHNGH